jgi:hypothetical protein
MPAGNSAFVKKREAGVRRAPSFGICLKWGAPDLFEIASGTNRMRTGFGRGQLLAQALVLAFKVPYSIREHFRRIVPRLHGVRGALLRRFFESALDRHRSDFLAGCDRRIEPSELPRCHVA